MASIATTLDNRKKLELFVDNCQLQTPEEVSRLFIEYTQLLWQYMLVGKIYDHYVEDIVMHHANGVTIQGLHNVITSTVAELSRKPDDLEDVFIDIFAEGNPEDGYQFMQATTYHRRTLNDGKPYEAPEGKVYSDDLNGQVGLCECSLRKVDGRWVLTEEWQMRAPFRQPK